MTKKVLVTDYAWPSLEPERAVLARVGAELVVAPDGDEDTLTELARDVDGILTCWAQTTERVIRAAEKCVVVGRYGGRGGQHRGGHGDGAGHRGRVRA